MSWETETVQERIRRKEIVCKRCVYSATMSGKSPTCDYLTTVGHKRPCDPTECLEKGVFKLRKQCKMPAWKAGARGDELVRISYPARLAEKLFRLRLCKGWTLKYAANKVGHGAPWLRELERGMHNRIQIQDMEKLAKLYECEPADLLKWR